VPNAEEFAESRRWAAAKFEGVQATTEPKSGLVVLANHDSVQLNNRNGRPMRLGEKEFTRGLYCHAVSKIEVRLPEPGKTFSAVVGVDRNEDTAGGVGSIVFSVSVGEKKAFDSGLMKVETPAKPVQIDLGGSTSFTLEVGDGNDGIYESIRVKLHGLDPNAAYVLTDLDRPGTKEMTGCELLDKGLAIVATNQPQATIITYKRK
jgi:hypothetical protein